MSVLGGLWPRGSLSKGVLCSRGSLSREGVSVHLSKDGGLCPEMRPPPVKTLPSVVVSKNLCVDDWTVEKVIFAGNVGNVVVSK